MCLNLLWISLKNGVCSLLDSCENVLVMARLYLVSIIFMLLSMLLKNG